MGGERGARAGEAVGGRWDCADAILVCFYRRLESSEARPGTMVRRRPGSGSAGLRTVGLEAVPVVRRVGEGLFLEGGRGGP